MDHACSLTAADGAGVLVYERQYSIKVDLLIHASIALLSICHGRLSAVGLLCLANLLRVSACPAFLHCAPHYQVCACGKYDCA